MNAIQTLREFIDRAANERKYADNTATGLKAALKLYEGSLNEGEKTSLDTLQANLNTIADDVFKKNKDDFSSATIVEYKRRIGRVISDYKHYGESPSKMAAWNPRRPSRLTATNGKTDKSAKKTSKNAKSIREAEVIDLDPARIIEVGAMGASRASVTAPAASVTAFDSSGAYRELNRSEVYIRDGLKVSLELPADLSQKEADKLKKYIDVMATGE